MQDPETLEQLGSPLRDLRRRFEEMAEPCRPALWRYCYRLTGSPWDAEDLVQETMIRAFARLTHCWQPLDPKPYLFRIATNAWIDQQRRNRLPMDEMTTADDLADAAPDPATVWGAMEHLASRLPPRQRVVVLLVDLFDFTAAEVAAMIRATEGSVRAALHRGRVTLRSPFEAAPSGETAAAVDPRPAPGVVAQLVDAFNRRDPDALAALLHEQATNNIIGVAEEYGRSVIRKYSLADWAADPTPQWAELGMLEGRPALFIYCRKAEQEKALTWIICPAVDGEQIVTMDSYWFCPELLGYAAEQLGVPAEAHGYRITG